MFIYLPNKQVLPKWTLNSRRKWFQPRSLLERDAVLLELHARREKLPLDETNRWDIPGADGLVPDESSCGQLTVCTNYLCGSRGLAETKDWREFKEQFIVLRVFSVEHWTKLRPYCRLSDSHALSPMMQQTLCGREKERLNNIFMRVLHFFRARQLP